MKVNIGMYPEDGSDRKIKVKIHKYDVWNLDNTLALIIAPALRALECNKSGAPLVDNCDVPEELWMSDEHNYDDAGETDPMFFKRFDYVLTEMVWAFEQIANGDSDAQFHTGVRDLYWQPLDENKEKIGEPYPFGEEKVVEGVKLFSTVKGPKDTSHFDSDGYTKHHERIKRGTMLFGKYYQALWD